MLGALQLQKGSGFNVKSLRRADAKASGCPVVHGLSRPKFLEAGLQVAQSSKAEGPLHILEMVSRPRSRCGVDSDLSD